MAEPPPREPFIQLAPGTKLALAAIGVVVAVGIGIAVFTGGGDGDDAGVTDNGGGIEDSLEFKLATVEKGKPVDASDPLVLRFRSLLQALRLKCREGAPKLADMAVAARDMLREQGIQTSMVSILEFVNGNTALPSARIINGKVQSAETDECAPMFALFVSNVGD